MKKIFTYIVVFFSSCMLAVASSIKWDVATLDDYRTWNWAWLQLSGVPGVPNFDIDYEVQNGVLIVSVDHSLWTLAHAMNFVEMHVGDTVDETTVRGSDIVYFHGQWLEEPGTYVYRDLQIQEGETAYLGFAVDEDIEGIPVQYGWLSIIFDGSGPVLGQSAVELSGAPIVILPRQIPEPGTLSLVLFGIVALSMRRRM